MSTPVIDWAAEAKKFGGRPADSAAQNTDWEVEAAKFGGRPAARARKPNEIKPQMSGARKLAIEALNLLPAAGMTLGAGAGTIVGLPAGPVAVGTGMGGAAIGGAAGEALRQLLLRIAFEEGPDTPEEAASSITEQAAIGAGSELLGPALSKIAPTLKRLAVRGMEKVLNPTKEVNKRATEEIAPELVKRGVKAWTRPGMEAKLGEHAEEAGRAVQAAEEQAVKDEALAKSLGNRSRLFGQQKALPRGPIQALPKTPGAATEVPRAEAQISGWNLIEQPRPLTSAEKGQMEFAMLPASATGGKLPKNQPRQGVLWTNGTNLDEGFWKQIPQYSPTPKNYDSIRAALDDVGREQARDAIIAKNTMDGTIKLLLKKQLEPSGFMDSRNLRVAVGAYKSTMLVKGTKTPVVGNAAGVDAIDQQIAKLDDLVREQGRYLSSQSGISLRRILDKQVTDAAKGAYVGIDPAIGSMTDARREFANALRRELSRAHPDLAAVNAEFHFWKSAYDVMAETNARKIGQEHPVTQLLRFVRASTYGAALGTLAHSPVEGVVVGATLDSLGKAMQSTAWRTVSAATKNGIANKLASGDYQAVATALSRLAAPVKKYETPQLEDSRNRVQ